MTKLTWNFTLSEATFSQTATRKGIDNTPNVQQFTNMRYAAQQMEQVRSLLDNKPIRISSWFRCPTLNKAIGGSATSAHCDGFAIDFTCTQIGTPYEVAKKLADSGIKFDQIINEGTWVHISFAPAMRQELLTAHFNNGKTTYTEGI